MTREAENQLAGLGTAGCRPWGGGVVAAIATDFVCDKVGWSARGEVKRPRGQHRRRRDACERATTSCACALDERSRSEPARFAYHMYVNHIVCSSHRTISYRVECLSYCELTVPHWVPMHIECISYRIECLSCGELITQDHARNTSTITVSN